MGLIPFKVKRRLYESLPLFLKRFVSFLPFSVMARREYRQVMRRGVDVRLWDREDIRNYQGKQLEKILTFACDQVPAYANYYRFLKFGPFEALKAFPLLSKEDLMADIHRFLPRDFDKIPHYRTTTGGTSGRQLNFYLDDASPLIEAAFIHRLWSWVGYTPRCKKATFRGFEFSRVDQGIYWQHNPIYNELQFSPYHINDQTWHLYSEQLQRYKPQFVHGYPSAISLLAKYFIKNGVNLSGIKAVILASESVYDDQRKVIESAFQARAFSFYGHTERIILAGECEQTTAYHHIPDYGFLEVISDTDESVRFGETGELVGTGFWTYSLPLIRYRTGDRARLLDPFCKCGRQFDRFDQVEGRWKQEFVVGKNGSKISIAALNIHGPFFDNVLRYQYYQDTPGVLELHLMAMENFCESDRQLIHQAYRKKVGDELEIRIIVVDEIPLTGRGKLKRLIQKMPS